MPTKSVQCSILCIGGAAIRGYNASCYEQPWSRCVLPPKYNQPWTDVRPGLRPSGSDFPAGTQTRLVPGAGPDSAALAASGHIALGSCSMHAEQRKCVQGSVPLQDGDFLVIS
jgi:hypothetical protein